MKANFIFFCFFLLFFGIQSDATQDPQITQIDLDQIVQISLNVQEANSSITSFYSLGINNQLADKDLTLINYYGEGNFKISFGSTSDQVPYKTCQPDSFAICQIPKEFNTKLTDIFINVTCSSNCSLSFIISLTKINQLQLNITSDQNTSLIYVYKECSASALTITIPEAPDYQILQITASISYTGVQKLPFTIYLNGGNEIPDSLAHEKVATDSFILSKTVKLQNAGFCSNCTITILFQGAPESLLSIEISTLNDLEVTQGPFFKGYVNENSLNYYQFINNGTEKFQQSNVEFTIQQYSGDMKVYLNYGQKVENIQDYQWSFLSGSYANKNIFILTADEIANLDPALNQTFYIAFEGTTTPSSFIFEIALNAATTPFQTINNNVQYFSQVSNAKFQNFTIFSSNNQNTTQTAFPLNIQFIIKGTLNLYIKSCGNNNLNCSITKGDITQTNIDPSITVYPNYSNNTIYMNQTNQYQYFSLAILNNDTNSTVFYSIYANLTCLVDTQAIYDTIPYYMDDQTRNQVQFFKYQVDPQQFNETEIIALDLNFTLIFGDATVFISQTNQNPNIINNLQTFNLSQQNYLSLTPVGLGPTKIFNPIYVGISTQFTKLPTAYLLTAHLRQTQYELTYLSLGIPLTYSFSLDKLNFFCFQGYNFEASNKIQSEIYYQIEILPISGDFQIYFGDNYMPKEDDYNISTGDYNIRIDGQDALFKQNQLSYIFLNLIKNGTQAPSFKIQLLNSQLINYIYPFYQSGQALDTNDVQYWSFNFYPGTKQIDVELNSHGNDQNIEVGYQIKKTNNYIEFNNKSTYTQFQTNTKIQFSLTEDDWQNCQLNLTKKCTAYFIVSLPDEQQPTTLNYNNQVNITLNPLEILENEETLNWCLGNGNNSNNYYIKLEKLIQALAIDVILSEPANFTLLAIAKDSSKLDNETAWPYPDINTPESYTFNTKFLGNETITNTTLKINAQDILKNSQCTFNNSTCYVLFSAYNVQEFYSYQLKMIILPIITDIINQNLTFNASTNASVQSQAYAYFNINLINCTSCNLYLTVSNISDNQANLQLLVNQGSDNYPNINSSTWNTSTQFEDFTITNLSSGVYTVGVYSDVDTSFLITANQGEFVLIEIQLGQNQLIELNETVPIVYLKLFNFNENDLKLLFENVEDDQIEIYITNIQSNTSQIIENLPNIDNAYWSSSTQPINEKLLFWLIMGQQSFCQNCTYLIKLEYKGTQEIQLLVIPTNSAIELPFTSGQTLNDEAIGNQTTIYKFTGTQKENQKITVAIFEGNITMQVKPIAQTDPDKYDWEQLNLTQVQTNDGTGEAYQAVRTPKQDEEFALFQVNCESQNTTTECTSIYNIQIADFQNYTILNKGTYSSLVLQANETQTYQLISDSSDSFKIIFQYRNCTLIQLITEEKSLVTCTLSPTIQITYYLNSDANKTSNSVDLNNMTIVTETNDFLIVNQDIQNATYTITLVNNNQDNSQIYCGIFYQNSADYNEVTLLQSRNSLQSLYYQQIAISEIFEPQNSKGKYALQVEIAQCSGFIHSHMSNQFGDIMFNEQQALKLIPTKYKYCGNLANELEIVDTPMYLKYQSTAESILTDQNEFLVQLNYIPLGVDNAYNCLYPGNNGTIIIDKSHQGQINFTFSQIQQLSTCNADAFTYQIKGYWLVIDKVEEQVLCSLNIQSSQNVAYIVYQQDQVILNPISQNQNIIIPNTTINKDPNAKLFIGIKAQVEVKYANEAITNNYTFTYQIKYFNCLFDGIIPPEATQNHKKKAGLSGGTKAVIAIVVILGVVAACASIWLYIKRSKRKRDSLINFEEDQSNKRTDVELYYQQGKKEKYNEFLDG